MFLRWTLADNLPAARGSFPWNKCSDLFRRSSRRVLALTAGLMMAGCTPHAQHSPVVKSASPGAPMAEPVSPPAGLTRQQRRAGYLPLALLLPDAEGWASVSDTQQRYEAQHAPSGSKFLAEVVDGAFSTSVYCASVDRPGDGPRRDTRIDGGTVRAPLALEVAYEAFAERKRGDLFLGTLRAHAAAGGRCYRLTFETRARGPEAESEIGARLAFFCDVSLPSLLLVRDGHGTSGSRTSLEPR